MTAHTFTTTLARAKNRAVPWFAFASLCLAGAVVSTLSNVLPHPATANMAMLWINTVAAFVTGGAALALALARDGLRLRYTHAFLLGGTLLITNAAYQSGDGDTYYAIWYVWVALYAFSFYTRRMAALHLASVAVAYAIVLDVHDAESGVGRWVTTIATLLIAATFVDQLVRGLRRNALAVEELMGRLEDAARTDGLTGLPNRRSWDEELTRAIATARRFGLPVAIAVLDLDGFKALNDSRGHQAGDRLLRDAAGAWSAVLREVDTLARWGGDEFGLIVTGCDVAQATAAVERIRATTPVGVRCSAGLAVWDGVEDESALMSRADDALYQAKRGGRNRTVVSQAPAPAHP